MLPQSASAGWSSGDGGEADTAAISRRFRPVPVWIAVETALGAWHPVLGVAVLGAFIPFYWWPIKGEIASVERARERAGGEPAAS